MFYINKWYVKIIICLGVKLIQIGMICAKILFNLV